MNLNLYLPDDLGREAKEAGLPLSQLLRGAVEEELERRKMMAATLQDAREHLLDLVDDEGEPYTGRLHGTCIVKTNDDALFLTTDERVIFYSGSQEKTWELGCDPQQSLEEELRDCLPDDDAYIAAARKLGLKPVVDI